MNLTLLVKVEATVTNETATSGTYKFPMIPPGARVTVISKDPRSPNSKQLWLLEATGERNLAGVIVTPLTQFLTFAGVTRLTYQTATDLGKSWQPGFRLPPSFINLM